MAELINRPDAATGTTTAKQERYEKKMAKYAANKARREQKAANRHKSESTIRYTGKVYVSDKAAEGQLENIRAKENKKFNYSEYMNAPITSVKYLDDNKFEIVVGAGGEYHYDDVYDNAAVEILNTTTFVVERVAGKSGHYEITEALGKKMTDNEYDFLEEKYRTLYEIIGQNFVLYHEHFDYTPKDFTHFVRDLMRPLSMIERDRENLKKAKQMYNNGQTPFFTVLF